MGKKDRIIQNGIKALRKSGDEKINDHGIYVSLLKGYHDLEKIIRKKSYHRIILREESEKWIKGQSISDHLTNTSNLIIYANTLGHEVDRRIREISATDLSYAVILDVLANEYLEEELREEFELWEKSYGTLAGPFSPGYGDYPLSMSDRIIHELRRDFSMEICVNSSYHLQPKKTITGITAIKTDYKYEDPAKEGKEDPKRKCRFCAKKTNCNYGSS